MTDPRTITLENALKALGINPDNDPIYHAKRWIEGRDTDRRERDQAITERDNATARVAARDLRIEALEGERDAALKQAEENKRWGEQYRQALNHFTIKMGLNQNADLDQHMAHVAKVCESFDTLTKIRLIFGQPDDVVGVIKSVCVELDNANDRADKAKATLAEIRTEIRKALDAHEAEMEARQAVALEEMKAPQTAPPNSPTRPALTDTQLLERAVRAAHVGRPPRWRCSHVMQAFALGSSSAATLCHQFGLNPDEVVGDEHPDDDSTGEE